jgi:GT2 family glycosyltransferase
MTSPRASIVIVNYNGGRHLDECLSAIFRHSALPLEVIVVDNASTDRSVTSLTTRYPQVRLLESETNEGYARAVNAGARLARGEYLIILNMDVIAGPSWLEPLIDFLAEQPEAGAAAPLIMLYDRPGWINAVGQSVHVSGLGFNRKLDRPVAEADPAPVRVSGLQGGAFAMRTETFHEVGGMNEAYFLYHEDVELSLRLSLAGYQIYAIPDSVVHHKYVLHMTPEKLHWLERHRWLTILGTYRLGTLAVLAPVLLLTEGMMAAYCLMRGRPFVQAKLGAAKWVLSHRAEVQQSRRKTQAVRRVSDWQVLSGLSWWYNHDQFLTLARQKGGWLYEAVSGLFARRAHDRVA